MSTVQTKVKMPTVDVALKLFFDRDAVVSAVGKAQASVMAQSGAYVAKAARRSIKDTQGKMAKIHERHRAGDITSSKRDKLLATQAKPSAAGSPPKSRTGLLKDFIFFSYDKSTGGVVVGPTLLHKSGSDTVPHLLEFGGDFGGTGVEGTGDWKTIDGEHVQTLKRTSKTKHMPKRPYMNPALIRSKDKLAQIWAGSIKRGRA